MKHLYTNLCEQVIEETERKELFYQQRIEEALATVENGGRN